MQQHSQNRLAENVKYQDLQILTESPDGVHYTKSIRSIAAIATGLCDAILSCTGGGIGVFDQNKNSVTLMIPMDCGGDRTAAYDDESFGRDALNVELVNHWINSRQFLFRDNLHVLRGWQSCSNEIDQAEMKNVVCDSFCRDGDSQVCFCYLANVDESELPKYRIIMKLLLSSMSSALLRLTNQEDNLTETGESLTQREQEILVHIRAGANNKMIARQLNISVNTVKSHIYNTFQKLGARNRVEALVKAKQSGYLV
jgi:DNA-binding CsgD family transcriptional regulator